ncbi:ABC transporter transmembrane domain-containing protein [OM182 bacterium]|nr:ABC transporter transmembrane domain-containing protein [OM182 bacterium]
MSNRTRSAHEQDPSAMPTGENVIEPINKKISNRKIFRTTWQFMRPYASRIALASIALIFTAGLSLALVQIIRIIVDSGFVAGSNPSLNVALLGFVGVAVLQAIGTFARFYWVSWLGERVTADIRKSVFSQLLLLHPGFFESNLSGEISSRITTDTTLIQTVIGSSVSIALRNFLMLIGGTGFLFITNPRLTSIVLLCIPLVVGPIIFFGRRVRSLSRDTQDEIANVGAYVGEAIQQIKTVQAFNHQEHDKRQFDRHVEAAFAVSCRRIYMRSILITVVMTLVFSALAAMIWVGGQDVISGRMSAGELTAFVAYAIIVAAAVGAISQVLSDLQRAAGAMERLVELLESESAISEPEGEHGSLPDPLRGEINIINLRFCYPSRPEIFALNEFNLTIRSGESLALVGSSGAGKSTLIDLILRFYDPQTGCVTLDNVDIKTLHPEVLRRHMAVVSQQPALFTGTVLENIRYSRPEASEEEVSLAAKNAFAEEFIAQLPEGFQSHLGEGGVRLSGGQRQRLAIARAILKNPSILLLDEATSALDAESEQKVQLALDHLMKGRTSIVIAHRLATIKNVDRIVVMKNGKIVAEGSHEDLLLSSSLYNKLAKLQFN